jgi:hypothetical protein
MKCAKKQGRLFPETSVPGAVVLFFRQYFKRFYADGRVIFRSFRSSGRYWAAGIGKNHQDVKFFRTSLINVISEGDPNRSGGPQ